MSSLAKQIKQASQNQTKEAIRPLLIEQYNELNKFRKIDLSKMEEKLEEFIAISEKKVIKKIADSEKQIKEESKKNIDSWAKWTLVITGFGFLLLMILVGVVR